MGTISACHIAANGSGRRRPRIVCRCDGSCGSASSRAPVLAPIPARAAASWRVWVLRWCMYSLACWSVMCVPGKGDPLGENRHSGTNLTPPQAGPPKGNRPCRGRPTAGLRPASGQPRQSPSRSPLKTILIVAAQSLLRAVHVDQDTRGPVGIYIVHPDILADPVQTRQSRPMSSLSLAFVVVGLIGIVAVVVVAINLGVRMRR